MTSDAEGMSDRLCADLIERWQRGERVPVEAYLRQHPELENQDAIFELVLTEVALRQSFEEPTPFEEYRWRFPQFDERLARHFALQEGLTQDSSLSESSEHRPDELRPDPPMCVAGYEILGELGRGGMGIVYLALDRHLDRQVALKFLPPEYADDSARLERFLREARTASALNHPQICTVHALGEHEGRPFIVMELIEGLTLKSLMRRALDIEEIVRLFAQVAQALAVAHAEGIVHRDIKPENIMVRNDGYVKVLDFGLARRLPKHLLEDQGPKGDTDPGTLLGTVAYMAPEQARGHMAESASDIHALGVVLYEFLTGRHPFETESALGMLHLIANYQPISASRLNPEIPQPLEGLLEAMLRKDAALRPTARKVEAALSKLFRTERPKSLPSRSRLIVHRQRELDVLRDAWHETEASHGRLICVTGEPGIGKTTLVEDFLDEIAVFHPDCLIARGRCSERLAGTEAYLPILDALGDLLRSEASGSMAQFMRAVAPSWFEQIASSSPAFDAVIVEPNARAHSQPALLREFSNLLHEASRLSPVVLFLDDVHWADVSTVDLLGHIGRLADQMRVLIVVTCRPTELLLGPHPFHRIRQELQMRGNSAELSVSFLGRSEIDDYLSLEFPDHKFPAEFANLLFARTEGSPLFLADLLKDLRERGVVAKADDGWNVVQGLPDLMQDLPASVRSMIERKLDRLEPADRVLLSAASVQGYEFDSAIVADALSLTPADVEERLWILDQIHCLVRRLRESEFPDRTLSVRYHFVHILYQQALYQALQPSRRAAMAKALAAILERKQGPGHAAAAELACLYEVGRDFVRAAGQFYLAAQNAAHVFAHHEAVSLAQRGLALLESLARSPERAALELPLQTILGMQLQVTDGFAAGQAKKAYLRAYDLCQSASDDAFVFPVLWGLWLYSKVRSELGRAQDMAHNLQDLATRLCDPDLAIQAHQALGMTAFCQGRPANAVEHVEQVSSLYDPNRHQRHAFLFGQDPAVICKAFGAIAFWLLGFADQAKRQSDEAIRMSRRLSPSSQAVALHFAAMLHQLRRDNPRVRACAEESRAIAKEHGFSFWFAGANVFAGWAMADDGEPEGIEWLREGIKDWQATDSVTYQTYYLGLLGEVLAKQGAIEDGLRILGEALALANATGERLYAAELHRLRGELLLLTSATDATTDAAQCFAEALAMARAQEALALELRAAFSLAKLLHRQGRPIEARLSLSPLWARFTEGFDSRDALEVGAFLEELPS
jgi:serine/threonine protein kinase/predicted ATPase